MPKLTNSARLGFGSIDCQSVNIDWQEARGEDLEGFEVQLPTITLGIIAEHAPDLLTKAQARKAERSPATPAPDDVAEEFQGSDSYYEWKDAFEPMMNYAYPVFIYDRDGLTVQDVADRLEEFAPACSLIYFGEHSDLCPETYAFALTGGGMNLSDHIAVAYLCADQVPPTWVLQSLSNVGRTRLLDNAAGPLKKAYAMAADAMRSRARDLTREKARIFTAKPAL